MCKKRIFVLFFLKCVYRQSIWCSNYFKYLEKIIKHFFWRNIFLLLLKILSEIVQSGYMSRSYNFYYANLIYNLNCNAIYYTSRYVPGRLGLSNRKGRAWQVNSLKLYQDLYKSKNRIPNNHHGTYVKLSINGKINRFSN